MSKLSIADVLIGSGMLIAVDAVLDLFGVISEQSAPAYYYGIIALTAFLVVFSVTQTLIQKKRGQASGE